VYVSGKVKDEMQIRQVRDYVWVAIQAHEYYKKLDPHITIVPAMSVDEKNLDVVESIIDSTSFRGSPVEIKMLSVWKNIHRPYVVQLDVDLEFNNQIKELIEELRPYANNKLPYPDKPHISLFKTQGWWDDIPRETKKDLQHEIASAASIRDTEISHTVTKIV
jgi:2'-5' RNA ligase